VRRPKQVLLSQAQLKHGLVAQPGVPPFVGGELVPWEPIAEVRLEPDQLAARTGLIFQDTFDGLDYLKLAVVDLDSGQRIALVRHRGRPLPPGTLIHCLPQRFTSATDLPGVMAALDEHQDVLIEETLETLGLEATDVVWRRPPRAWRCQHGAESLASENEGG
jgi:hypothetical protein